MGVAGRPDAVVRTADVEGWQLATVRVGQGEILRIYIEGDGRAYLDYATPSADPTPLKPVGLQLALADKGSALYVARPCQWVKGAECKERTLWTRGRFSEDVARRYAELVANETRGRPVELVGFSGGAWVALQVAARLDNVTRVVTVAGNMMPNVVNASHNATPMVVAEYPKGKLGHVPVKAYVGTKDKVVGREVVRAFEDAMGAKVEVVPVDAGHTDGWDNLVIE